MQRLKGPGTFPVANEISFQVFAPILSKHSSAQCTCLNCPSAIGRFRQRPPPPPCLGALVRLDDDIAPWQRAAQRDVALLQQLIRQAALQALIHLACRRRPSRARTLQG